jgi:multiple sugar transport system permease protein
MAPTPGAEQVFRIGRWVVIIAFLIAVLVPFYYMLLLSVKPIESLLRIRRP